jgi:mycofactocin system transcriptional regulator
MSLGRPPTTTHDQIAAVALELFAERGFEETTVDEIAAAVGVGRRTIFRYFPSKNDMVWGDFDWVIERLRAHLREGDDLPLAEALRRAAVLSNSYPEEELPSLTAPALQANSMLRYSAWRRAIAEWAAERRGEDPEDVVPTTIAECALGASRAAFTRWVSHPEEDLATLLEAAYEVLSGDALDVTASSGAGDSGADGQRG